LTQAADGTRLFYEHLRPSRGADSPTALLLAPLGLSSRLYSFATELARGFGYAPLVFDNRGSGRSDIPRRPWSITTMAEDAVAVLDAAGVDRAHVCGPSLGGFVAQALALRFPQRVGALVLASTTAGWPRLDLMPWRYALLALVGRLRREARGSVHDPGRALLSLMVSPQFAAATEVGSPIWRVASALAQEARSRRGLAGQVLAASTYVGWPNLPSIKAPIQIQHGTDDRVVPFRAGRELTRRLPDAELVPFAGAGHALILERPEAVAEVSRAFLRARDELLVR
jgi:3-oxoadipate enol-lactonase